VKEQFLHISSVAVKKLFLFSSTYLCETVFSRYAASKMKYQNRLYAEHDMRLQLSKTAPNFNSFVASKPVQP
jgi:hypothetical protein